MAQMPVFIPDPAAEALVNEAIQIMTECEMIQTLKAIGRLAGKDRPRIFTCDRMRVTLLPFAELALRELVDLAKIVGLPSATKDARGLEILMIAGFATHEEIAACLK